MISRHPLLIVGMHRSGTSCLAGCLESGGLTLGDVNEYANFNKRGTREHEAIRDIHDSLFESAGASWDRPPISQISWTMDHVDQLKDQTKAFEDVAHWGLKDPRSIFCLNGWKALFEPRYVVTYRHPLAVRDSLVTRAEVWKQPMSSDHALEIWVAYNKEVLRQTEGTPTPYIRYDVAPDAYKNRLAKICRLFGLDIEKACEFYSTSLTNFTANDEDIPEHCRPVWNELEARFVSSLT